MKLIVLFYSVPNGKFFKNLHGDQFKKLDSVRAQTEDGNIINFPSEEGVYIEYGISPLEKYKDSYEQK